NGMGWLIPIGHCTINFHYFGQPTAVLLQFDLNRKRIWKLLTLGYWLSSSCAWFRSYPFVASSAVFDAIDIVWAVVVRIVKVSGADVLDLSAIDSVARLYLL